MEPAGLVPTALEPRLELTSEIARGELVDGLGGGGILLVVPSDGAEGVLEPARRVREGGDG